jgi:hypothetical protein
MSEKSNTKVFHTLEDGSLMTAEGRLFFAKYLLTAHENDQKKMVHAMELCFPPETDLKPLKKMLGKVAMEHTKNDEERAKELIKGRLINPCKLPKGGSRGSEFEGWTLIRATSQQQPDFVWPNGSRMTIEEAEKAIKSGYWIRATIKAFPFKNPKNSGISIGLRNVQFLRPGPTIGYSKPDGEDEFAAIPGAEKSSPKKQQSENTESGDIDDLFND